MCFFNVTEACVIMVFLLYYEWVIIVILFVIIYFLKHFTTIICNVLFFQHMPQIERSKIAMCVVKNQKGKILFCK